MEHFRSLISRPGNKTVNIIALVDIRAHDLAQSDAGSLASASAVTKLLLPPGVQPDQMAADQIRRVLGEMERSQAIVTN